MSNPSELRSFSHNICGWQSDTKMNKRYDSFKELGELIKECSAYHDHIVGECYL